MDILFNYNNHLTVYNCDYEPIKVTLKLIYQFLKILILQLL